MRESTVRSCLKKYNEQVRIEKILNQTPAEHIFNLIQSRTLAADVLLCTSEDLSIKNIKTTPLWRRSIFQRLGLRVATTRNVEVPEGARKEAGLQHHFRIVNII